MRRIVINQALGVLRKRERMRESPFSDLSPSFDAGGCRIQQAWQTTDTPETLLASSQVTTAVLAAIEVHLPL